MVWSVFLALALWTLQTQGQAFTDDTALNYTTPTRALAAKDYPTFTDDLQLAGLGTAVQNQLAGFKGRSMSGSIELGGKRYPLSKAVDSLNVLGQLIIDDQNCRTQAAAASCDQQFNQQLQTRFNVFVPDLKPGDPRYGQANNSLFTGYATQPIDGSMTPDANHTHALYTQPPLAKDRDKSRGEIDFLGGLKGLGLELVYGSDLYDLYLLAVEGGGYVSLGGGRGFYVQFDGTNGQRWDFISDYMIKKGYIQNRSIGAQRKFLRLHPDQQQEIYSQCPSYVYMRTTTTPPVGSEGVPVTAGRTIATDFKLYSFKGLVAFIQAERPVDTGTYDLEQEDFSKIPFQPFSRFVIDQDTGGAITGKGRADIYFGLDGYAQYAASYEEQLGQLYFLLLK